jgi:hypothetical protein
MPSGRRLIQAYRRNIVRQTETWKIHLRTLCKIRPLCNYWLNNNLLKTKWGFLWLNKSTFKLLTTQMYIFRYAQNNENVHLFHLETCFQTESSYWRNHHHHHHHLQNILFLAIAFLKKFYRIWSGFHLFGFYNIYLFLQRKFVSLAFNHPSPPTWRTRSLYLCTRTLNTNTKSFSGTL